MKDKALYIIAIIVVLAIGFKIFGGAIDTGSDTPADDDKNIGDITGATVTQDNSDVQVVNVGLDRGTYTFSPAQVEAGKPVLLKNDGSIRGCANQMVQKELGINANFAANKEYRFTPNKKGNFRVVCSMNMYSGMLKVV